MTTVITGQTDPMHRCPDPPHTGHELLGQTWTCPVCLRPWRVNLVRATTEGTLIQWDEA